jgi:hypothetical protein
MATVAFEASILGLVYRMATMDGKFLLNFSNCFIERTIDPESSFMSLLQRSRQIYNYLIVSCS